MTKDEQLALSRLRKDDSIVITPADKGRVTVVMNKTEYREKMDNLVSDDKTYKKLKSDSSKKLERKLNENLYPLHQANILKRPLYSRLYCSVAQTPKLYGLLKIHKDNTPLRPIVSFCSSPTYELSKYLANILKPLTEQSSRRLVNSADFVTKIRNVQLSEDHELVSFDVKSLFTSIPLELAIESVKESLANYSDELRIPKEEVIDLLILCLQSTFFQYDGNFYQQLHGTAMGSPVSVVVAEIVMQRLEEKALATYTNPPPFWFRYVDDTLTSLHKDEKNNFLEHLNQQNPSIQFTIEPELNGKIAFLDCRVIRAGNTLQTKAKRSKAKRNTVIVGDSIIKYVKGWELSNATERVTVKSFSGATVDDMKDFIKPILRKNPEKLILHIGTNDLRSTDLKVVADKVSNLVQTIYISSVLISRSLFLEFLLEKMSMALQTG